MLRSMLPLILGFMIGSCGGHRLPDACVPPARHGKTPTAQYVAVGQIHSDTHACTGTLITPTIVLTAGHCAFADRAWFRLDDGKETEIVGWERSPADDLAVGFLLTPITHIEPMDVAATQPPGHHTLSVVGYGCNSSCATEGGVVRSGSGVKRYAMFPSAGFRYDWYRSDLFWVCQGDSGGPVIETETGKIVAVVSAIYIQGSGRETRYAAMRFSDPTGMGL